MNKKINYELCQSVTDLCNLLIISNPSDGPMVKGILRVSLMGLKDHEEELDEINHQKLVAIKDVYKSLCCGSYTVLPFHATPHKESTYNLVKIQNGVVEANAEISLRPVAPILANDVGDNEIGLGDEVLVNSNGNHLQTNEQMLYVRISSKDLDTTDITRKTAGSTYAYYRNEYGVRCVLPFISNTLPASLFKGKGEGDTVDVIYTVDIGLDTTIKAILHCKLNQLGSEDSCLGIFEEAIEKVKEIEKPVKKIVIS